MTATFRTLLALAAAKGYSVSTADVRSAYLHGECKEKVFMRQATGYVKTATDGQTYWCRLLKYLYGLKQAGRGWNLIFTKWFSDHGFEISSADPCLFVFHGDPEDFLVFA